MNEWIIEWMNEWLNEGIKNMIAVVILLRVLRESRSGCLLLRLFVFCMVSHRGEHETQMAGEEGQLLPAFLCAQIFIERETSGYEAVVVAGTSYQMKEAFINSILLSGEGLTFFSNRTKHFWWKKRNEAFQAVFFFFSEHAQKLQVKSRTRTRSRPQILSSLTLIQHGMCFKITPACWDLPQRQHQVKRWMSY